MPRARSLPKEKLEAAFAGVLDALALPPAARADPELAGTPRRAAEAWWSDLADGYRMDPAAILRGSMDKVGSDLVAVTGIDFHSICPHHLLPYRGLAHVAYVPAGRVVGFGQLARLVDCFAHRLVIEEKLARDIAQALMDNLGAKGAAVVLDAEQQCLSIRGEKRRRSRAHAECFLGALDDGKLQRRFLRMVDRGRGAK